MRPRQIAAHAAMAMAVVAAPTFAAVQGLQRRGLADYLRKQTAPAGR
ncbi:hypothetical protein MNR01_00650 [Lysobacter sp. S4-A87]|nr:hypothetical protein [Lysobacter sp. S4-A87]UNK49590.1 hypothetical protein MNR01_00650 [Lysobacter sp. S4-A87]